MKQTIDVCAGKGNKDADSAIIYMYLLVSFRCKKCFLLYMYMYLHRPFSRKHVYFFFKIPEWPMYSLSHACQFTVSSH